MIAHYIKKVRSEYEADLERYMKSAAEAIGMVLPKALYRTLSLSDQELRTKVIANVDLSEVMSEAQHALNVGFPGTMLKLGRDLWIGNERKKQDSYRLLSSA